MKDRRLLIQDERCVTNCSFEILHNLSLLIVLGSHSPGSLASGQTICHRTFLAAGSDAEFGSTFGIEVVKKEGEEEAAAARMCSLHGCCDHGIHSARNTPDWKREPDRGRQGSRDSMFGAERGSAKQTTVSQPREVTRLSSRSDCSDRHDRSDTTLHSRLDNQMNIRSDSNSNVKHVHVIISGKVQGVTYRKWTVENATKLGLNGWVRNCKDGTVEATISGKPGAVERMLDKCKSGPSRARVANVAVNMAAGAPKKGFEQLDDKRW